MDRSSYLFIDDEKISEIISPKSLEEIANTSSYNIKNTTIMSISKSKFNKIFIILIYR